MHNTYMYISICVKFLRTLRDNLHLSLSRSPVSPLPFIPPLPLLVLINFFLS